jgi:hypothetical protein
VSSPPRSLQTLVARYDRTAFEPQARRARVRLAVSGGDAWDAVLEGGRARLASAKRGPDATLTATERAWSALAQDMRGGWMRFAPVGWAFEAIFI